MTEVEQRPQFQLRALISLREASSLIGKEGSNIEMIKEQAGVSISVSKKTNATERIVTVKGDLPNIAQVSNFKRLFDRLGRYPIQPQES